MNKQELIKELYFEKKYNQKDIAYILNITKQYVSKVLIKDDRYKAEKERRKKINKEKHIEYTKNYMKKIRKYKNDTEYLIMKYMHNQASVEMSERKKLSNMAYRNWNLSAYTYNEAKKRFEFKDKLGRSYDVPKNIKVILR